MGSGRRRRRKSSSVVNRLVVVCLCVAGYELLAGLHLFQDNGGWSSLIRSDSLSIAENMAKLFNSSTANEDGAARTNVQDDLPSLSDMGAADSRGDDRSRIASIQAIDDDSVDADGDHFGSNLSLHAGGLQADTLGSLDLTEYGVRRAANEDVGKTDVQLSLPQRLRCPQEKMSMCNAVYLAVKALHATRVLVLNCEVCQENLANVRSAIEGSGSDITWLCSADKDEDSLRATSGCEPIEYAWEADEPPDDVDLIVALGIIRTVSPKSFIDSMQQAKRRRAKYLLLEMSASRSANPSSTDTLRTLNLKALPFHIPAAEMVFDAGSMNPPDDQHEYGVYDIDDLVWVLSRRNFCQLQATDARNQCEEDAHTRRRFFQRSDVPGVA